MCLVFVLCQNILLAVYFISGNVKIYPCTETKVIVFYVFNYIQISVAVITMNFQPAITDTRSKEGAQRTIDIVADVSVDLSLTYCAESYKTLGMFLGII